MTLTATLKGVLITELQMIMDGYEAFRTQLAKFGQNGGNIKPALEEEIVWENKIRRTKQSMRGEVVRPERQNKVVALGSPVTLVYPSGEKKKVVIDGAGFKNDKFTVISQTSPIGTMLMGKKRGNSILVDGKKIKIETIGYPW